MIGRGVGRACGGPGRGASLDGRGEERLLDAIEVPFELDEVEAFILAREKGFDFLGDLGMSQDPFVGRLRLVVASRELAPVPDLLLELHDREEEVGIQACDSIEPAEKFYLLRSVIAVVADKVADDGVVLLFDIAVVVLAVRTTAGEGDVFVLAVLSEVFVDELAAVVAVNPQKGKRKVGAAGFNGLENIAAGLVFRHFRLGPGCGHIGEGEGEGKDTVGTSAVMTDKIGLAEARTDIVPVGKCPDRNMMLQQRSRAGERAPFQSTLALGLGQDPIDRSCTGRDELFPDGLPRDAQSPLSLQERHDLADERHQTLATEPVGESPELSESIKEGFGPVGPPTVPLSALASPVGRDKDHALAADHAHLLSAAGPEDKGGITPVVPGQLNELA